MLSCRLYLSVHRQIEDIKGCLVWRIFFKSLNSGSREEAGGEGVSGSGRPSLPLPEDLVDPSLQQLSHIELLAFWLFLLF